VTGATRRRLWLAALVLYAAAGVADGATRMESLARTTAHPGTLATLRVAFCAGLFWPLDVAGRLLLGG